MFFQVYGEHALAQWGMLIVVLLGLILLNEFARRTKVGGIITFLAIPLALTVYFLAIWFGVRSGSQWALENQTHVYMQGWFHYAKLYAATAGCIGFMMIKYKWGIGAKHWFKPFPFVIVGINILIACVSDFESAIMGWNKWWLTSEGVWQYGGWHNVMNGIAGLVNIMCMTAWWNVYPSKDKKDMIWADMTWVYIVIYDIWNFAYTYNCLPTHSWYCGIALLLAPTVAALLWNRGGWIQNRANTLAIWCMFAQVFPLFQETFKNGQSRGREHHQQALRGCRRRSCSSRDDRGSFRGRRQSYDDDSHQRTGPCDQLHRYLLHHRSLQEAPHQSLQGGCVHQSEVLQGCHGPRRCILTEFPLNLAPQAA